MASLSVGARSAMLARSRGFLGVVAHREARGIDYGASSELDGRERDPCLFVLVGIAEGESADVHRVAKDAAARQVNDLVAILIKERCISTPDGQPELDRIREIFAAYGAEQTDSARYPGPQGTQHLVLVQHLREV